MRETACGRFRLCGRRLQCLSIIPIWQRRKERAAVPAFGAHLFVGKPAETEFLEIEQQGVGIQHPGVVLIDAENAVSYTHLITTS